MTKIKDNTDIIKLLPQQEAKFDVVMGEIRRMKQKGANGETTGAEKEIIFEIMRRNEYFQKLKVVEKQVSSGVYHKNSLKRLLWSLKRKLQIWKQRLQR